MKKLIFVLALLPWMVGAVAQQSDAGATETPLLDIEAQRGRIQIERAREEQRHQVEEVGCYARFAVTDCLREVRGRRRAVLDNLRRQEVILNDAERQAKAQQQLEHIREKSSAERLDEEAASRLKASDARKEREEAAAKKAAAAVKARPGVSAAAGTPVPAAKGRTVEEIAKDQKLYQDRLKEAQEYRAVREKSNREKSGPPSKPLPQYP